MSILRRLRLQYWDGHGRPYSQIGPTGEHWPKRVGRKARGLLFRFSHLRLAAVGSRTIPRSTPSASGVPLAQTLLRMWWLLGDY